jgi:NADH:ubiquinone oxidoreductase subunit 6 (subunit J)
MPNLLGTILIAVLEALYIIEWPITFILLQADASYLTALVIVRTAYVVGLAVLFGAIVFTTDDSPRWSTARCWAKLGSVVAILSVIALAIGALPLYAAQRYQADPMRQAVDLIKSNSTPDVANVLFDRVDTYERLAPFFPGWSQLAAMQLGGKADTFSAQKIQSFSTEKPEVWYVLDFGADQNKNQREVIDRQLSEALCKVSQEFAGSAQVSHFVNATPDGDMSRTAQFENGLQLDNVRVNHTTWGDPLCFELQWRTTRPLPTNYTIFIHVLDPNGQIVAQTDLQPGGGYAPTSSWPVGQLISDRHGLVLPPTFSPGEYHIVAGVYGPDGVRLHTTEGTDTILLSKVVVP